MGAFESAEFQTIKYHDLAPASRARRVTCNDALACIYGTAGFLMIHTNKVAARVRTCVYAYVRAHTSDERTVEQISRFAKNPI